MNEENDRPINLSGLDPTQDTERFDMLVENIMRAAGQELKAKRSAHNVVGELARWRAPVLTAAAAAIVFLLLSSVGVTTPNANAESTSGIAEAIGVPTELAAWVRGETEPSVGDIYSGVGDR